MPAMKAENYLNLESYKKEKIAEFLLDIQKYYSTQTKKLEQETLNHPENSIHFAGMIKQIEWMHKNVIMKQRFYNRIISKENYEKLKKLMRENNINIAKIPTFQSKILSDIIFYLNESSSINRNLKVRKI